MKIKPLVENFIAPVYKTSGSAGMDVYLQSDIKISLGHFPAEIPLGFCAEVPEGYVALILPRSSTGCNGLRLRNTVGVIDSDYRGEWKACVTYDHIVQDGYQNHAYEDFKRGDRLFQVVIVPCKQVDIEIVDELSTTDRGSGGFGSTGS